MGATEMSLELEDSTGRGVMASEGFVESVSLRAAALLLTEDRGTFEGRVMAFAVAK